MSKVLLERTHLEYILSQLPDKPDTSIGMQANSIIQQMIMESKLKDNSNELEWFYDPKNTDLPLKNFIDLPIKIKLMHVSEYFGTYSDPVYSRVIQALEKRKCEYIHQLLDLSIYQLLYTPRLGDRSHLAILHALIQKKNPSLG